MARPGTSLSLLAFAVWLAITVYGAQSLAPQETSLENLVSAGLSWNVLMAGVFLLIVVQVTGWQGLGLRRAAIGRAMLLAWVPLALIALAFAGALLLGPPPLSVLALVLVNCLLVAFSEELMFRGLLLRAFGAHLRLWPAVAVTTLMFGAVHLLNVLVTGELGTAAVQATMAAMTGLFFAALRLRTGSLLPPMIVHALWDFSIFSLGLARPAGGTSEDLPASASSGLDPLLLAVILPVFLSGLWLLRKVPNLPPPLSDGPLPG